MKLIYLTISLLLYLFAPAKYNLLFCNAVTILFLVQTIPFIIKRSQGNYVNFHTIFFLSFFLTNFFYPTVLYPIDPDFFSVFTLPFDNNYINKGTALAQLAASSFMLGSSSVKFNSITDIILNKKTYISHKYATYTTVFLFGLFLITVGRNFLAGDFTGHSTISLYILQLLTCSFILATIIFFKYFDFQKKKKIFFTLVIAYIFLFLSIGDRGPALDLLILIVGLYTFYVKKIGLKYLIILGISGIIGMHLIGLGRTTDISSAEGNILSRGIERTHSEQQFQSYFAVTQSFVVNTRNLYVGLEYVDKEGVNWGKTYIPSILGVIPFAQFAVKDLIGIEYEGSAGFFTTLAFGKHRPYGLGTNLVADVFLTFGLFGVIILFLLFGRTVELFRRKTLNKNDIYSNIVYFTLLSYSVYFPRTELFMPLKFILWTILIYYFLKQFKVLKSIPINTVS